MRVVLVVSEFPVVSEAFIVDKFLGLLQRGVDVHVVAETENPQNYAFFPKLDTSEHRRRVHGWRGQRRLGDNLDLVAKRLFESTVGEPVAAARWAMTELRRDVSGFVGRFIFATPIIALRPDIVHFEFGSEAVHRAHIAAATDAAVVVSFRGFDVNYYGIGDADFYNEIWHFTDTVHVLGEDLRLRALGRGLPQDLPTACIAPAVDAASFDASARREGVVGTADRPVRIVSVGRLHWKKGYEFALDALHLLARDGIHFEYRVIGDGPFREAVEAAVADHGLGEHVELLGVTDRAGVRTHMQWADVFLHAAVSEGFCNAALEAQAMQLPVVCTDADGLPECVADARSGLVVPRRNAGALADALARLAANGALRSSMGETGRARVSEAFRPEDQISAFVELYERVLAVRHARDGATQ